MGSKVTKSWKEQSQDEKIESLRSELISQRYVFHRVTQLEQELRDLREHSHSTSGQIMIPLKPNHGGGMLAGNSSVARIDPLLD